MIDYGQDSDHFVGTTAAIILAASAIGSAAVAHHAASNAAEAQQHATDQSLGLQTDVYRQTRADLAPYAAVGQGALGNLRSLAGIPDASTPAGGSAALSKPALVGAERDTLANKQAKAPPGLSPLSGATMAQPAATPNGSGSGYVLMRAPDGSTQPVDPQHVSFYQQRGAQVVS